MDKALNTFQLHNFGDSQRSVRVIVICVLNPFGLKYKQHDARTQGYDATDKDMILRNGLKVFCYCIVFVTPPFHPRMRQRDAKITVLSYFRF